MYRLISTLLILSLASCAYSSAASTHPSATVSLSPPEARESDFPFTPTAEPDRATETETTSEIFPTQAIPTKAVTRSPLPTPSPRPTSTLGEQGWKSLPIIPLISDHVVEIFRKGQALGNNPHAFSKIGDCGSTPTWFLGDFDRGEEYYRLGRYTSLQEIIRIFHGSFDRNSLAARSGFNASSVFASIWADRTYCQANEAPLACEYRVHRPSIAFIMLGTNDVYHPELFEPQMRKIIEFSIEQGVIPILSTKGDNVEKDGSINATIAKLALEYDIPLWNFWLAIQPLPNHGLQEDNVHLTWGRNFFDDPQALSKAWPLRNLTALLVLESIWLKLNAP